MCKQSYLMDSVFLRTIFRKKIQENSLSLLVLQFEVATQCCLSIQNVESFHFGKLDIRHYMEACFSECSLRPFLKVYRVKYRHEQVLSNAGTKKS